MLLFYENAEDWKLYQNIFYSFTDTYCTQVKISMVHDVAIFCQSMRCIPEILKIFQERHLLIPKKYKTIISFKVGSLWLGIVLQPFHEVSREVIKSKGIQDTCNKLWPNFVQIFMINSAYNCQTKSKLYPYCLYRHMTVFIQKISNFLNQLWCSYVSLPLMSLVSSLLSLNH